MGWTGFVSYFYDWGSRWIYEGASMQQITVEEQKKIYGGATSSLSSLINAIIKAASFLLDLGRNVGSSIRQSQTKTWC